MSTTGILLKLKADIFVHFDKFPNYNNCHMDHYLGGYPFQHMN